MGTKKTFVSTQVSRVIEDDKLPNSVKQGVLNALFQNGDIVDHVIDGLIASVGTKAERLYSFAEQGNYIHGLPSGKFTLPGDTVLDEVKAVLDVVHGTPVTMSYAYYGAPNSLHIGWQILIATHGYDPATNIIATVPGAPVGVETMYLEDMVLMVPPSMLDTIEPASMHLWGIAARAGYTPVRTSFTPETAALVLPSPVEVDISAPGEQLRVTYMWMDGAGVKNTDSFFIPVAGYDNEADYFHARYTVGGATHYIMYKDGEGTYPALDALFDTNDNSNGAFFPFIYFRYGKVSEIADKTTESYKDGVKLTKYLGLNYDDVAEAIEENPDIDDVEQAMIMFAVPANTEDEQERAYLFKFFDNMFLAQGTDLRFRSEAQANIASHQLFGSEIQPPGMVIQDARFKLSLSNKGVYKIRKAGTIAEVGKHSSGLGSFNVTTKYIEQFVTGPVEQTLIVPVPYHIYQKQITESIYEEIQVVDLQTRFHIFDKYSTIGDETDKILIIPLDHSITETYSAPDRERLYARSLHYVFNSLVTVTLKWYQEDWFQVVVVVVAFIITCYTMGGDGGTSMKFAAALAAGTYATMQFVLNLVLQFLVARLVFKLFVKAVGAEAAFVIAIVAAMAGFGMMMDSGGLAGSPWVQDLLALSSGLTDAIGTSIQEGMADLAGEMSEFDKYVEKQTQLLEKAEDLLQQDHFLSPFVIFGESPNDFYNRTVHSGNIGVVGIDAIASFVDSKLMLPTLDQTLGRGMEG